MRGLWLRSRIRGALSRGDRNFYCRSVVENSDNRHLYVGDTLHIWDCTCPSLAQSVDNDDAFQRVLGKVRAVISRRLTRSEAGTETGPGSAWTVGAATAVPLIRPSINPSVRPLRQILGSIFRTWSSLESHDEIGSQKVEKKFEGSLEGLLSSRSTGDLGGGNSKTSEAGGLGVHGGSKKVEKRGGEVNEKESLEPTSKDNGDDVDGVGCDYNEGWGNVPKKAVSEAEVARICQSLSDSGVEISESRSPCGEENLRLLLALGANEEQVLLLFRRHPRLLEERSAPIMLESAQIFHEFGADTTAFMHVVSTLNGLHRSNVYVWSASKNLNQIFTYLRDEVGVTNFKKMVTNKPFLSVSTLESLKGRVDALTYLGVVVDGDMLEKYGRLLSASTTSMKKTAHALELALGSKIHQKNPLILGVNAESVPKKVANLQAMLGTTLKAADFLLRQPTILMSREDTVRETWQGLVELFGKDAVVRFVTVHPDILRRNWKTFDAKFKYLTSKGFSKDDMIRCIARLSTRSLKEFVVPRVEVALGGGRVYEGGPTLSGILHSNLAEFEKKFGVEL